MKRRRHILCLLMIMASLFLYSCGIPTICTLNNININKVTTTDNTVQMTVKGTDTDLEKVSSSCPGLLLCYVETDDFVFTDSSKITSEFSKTVSNNSKIFINNNNEILTTDDYVLYAFQKDAAGARVSTPSYSLNLHPYITGVTMDADLTLEHVEGQQFAIKANSLYIRTEDREKTRNNFIHVFAAFSAEQGEFTNTYWSSLVYLGYIDITK